MILRFSLITIIISLFSFSLRAQINLGDDLSEIDYASPKEYEIGGITITGVRYLDNSALIMISGLSVGDKVKVPGEKISRAIEKLWEQGLFENIKISATKIQGNLIFLNYDFRERPRLSKYAFKGVRKSEAESLKDEIKLIRNDVITENLLIRTKNIIKKHFDGKGFLNVEINIRQEKDTAFSNSKILHIDIKKHKRVKIHKINIIGRKEIKSAVALRSLKNTKQKKLYRIFKSSKYIKDDFKEDKIGLIDKYNELGFRDAILFKDSIYRYNNRTVNIDVYINEGRKYYFRNISWVGNTKYTAEELNSILKIMKGDIYNQKVLDANLSFNPNGFDVSSLYLDDGYLFFQVNPVEVYVENDSIDLEIRIYEGKQARINKVSIIGNTRTNDHVVIREIRTKPGQLFSRSDIIRTVRELAQLRYFNAETLEQVPKPNPVDGTVDIEYKVEENSSDQFELSGGWGGGYIVGTLGLSFNNFSTRKFFKKGAWRPLPSGDGQKLAIRAQSNGKYYQAYNLSFTEPWLGGKKPNAFSIGVYHSIQSNGLNKDDPSRSSIKIYGISIGLSKRLRWPDDYFILSQGLSLQNYSLDNYSGIGQLNFKNGYANSLSYNIGVARNSIDAPIYPRSGSEISLALQLTPPYSLFSNKDYSDVTDQEKYKWIEYHKWKFKVSYFLNVFDNLVLSTRFRFAFLGYYNKDVGYAPFERYYVGGDGLSGYSIDSREVVGLRGYNNNSLTPRGPAGYIGATMYDKFTVEMRYPVSLNPNATIYMLGFLEAGNAWLEFDKFNPFSMHRSAGVGVRIFLPMFGLLGLDWGYGFDEIPNMPGANKGQFHFSINQSID